MVYGVQKLTVVDANLLPLILAFNLQIPMYAFAEQLTDIINSR
jgi:choline dehydrogenase-like flavoprotein